MKDKHEIKDEYFEKIEEWQENQYNPGYYTGGNIPPIITHTFYFSNERVHYYNK